MKLRMSLGNLKQGSGKFTYYLHDFNRLLNQIEDMSEHDKMLNFINGLHKSTQRRLRELRPKTLDECIEIASGVEYYHNNKPERSNSNNIRRSDEAPTPRSSYNNLPKHYTGNRYANSNMGQVTSNKSNIQCFKCKQYGHYSNKCTLKAQQVDEPQINKYNQQPQNTSFVDQSLVRPSQRIKVYMVNDKRLKHSSL